jgi:hypothetical protein
VHEHHAGGRIVDEQGVEEGQVRCAAHESLLITRLKSLA